MDLSWLALLLNNKLTGMLSSMKKTEKLIAYAASPAQTQKISLSTSFFVFIPVDSLVCELAFLDFVADVDLLFTAFISVP